MGGNTVEPTQYKYLIDFYIIESFVDDMLLLIMLNF